jgi:sugar (pentulose or hexulose) kinase
LYDYLKPLPEELTCWFLKKYGPAEKIASETASPVLGSLNAGLQLLWLKHHKPLTYNTICYSFHLPQWVSTLLLPGPLRPLSPCCCSEMTSVGCHTMLWDFRRRDYHYWVRQEQIAEKLPPLFRAFNNHQLPAATGLHDSSAALIPYLLQFPMPFILLSTGTWCIALNPFSTEPLTPEDLQQDCLCYLTLAGRPVRAARYFGGYEHDRFAQEIAETYGVSAGFYRSDPLSPEAGVTQSRWQAAWTAYETAMQALMEKQVHAVRLAMGRSAVQFLFVDGGFSKNHLYMRLLAAAFPDIRVRAAEIAQATATGAALTVHSGWNRQSLPKQLIRLNA